MVVERIVVAFILDVSFLGEIDPKYSSVFGSYDLLRLTSLLLQVTDVSADRLARHYENFPSCSIQIPS